MTNTQAIKDLQQKIHSLQARCCCKSFGLTDGVPSGAPTNGQEFLGDPATGIIYYWDGDSWEVYSSGGGGGGEFYFAGTYAETSAAADAGLLIPGAMYKITDRGDRGIYLNAISTSQFALGGIRVMLVPFTYDVDISLIPMSGIWHPNLANTTPSPGEYVAYAGFVYVNTSGNIGNPPDLDAFNGSLNPLDWDLIPKTSFSSGEYIEMIFGVHYDFINDWIAKQWDDKGNEIGHPFVSVGANPVDYTDWNLETRVTTGDTSFKDNKSLGPICGNAGNSATGGDIVIENNDIHGFNGICGNYADENVEIIYNKADFISLNGSGLGVEVNIRHNEIFNAFGRPGNISSNYSPVILNISKNYAYAIVDNNNAGQSVEIIDNIVHGDIISNSGDTSYIRYNIVQGYINSNTCSGINNNIVIGGITENTNSGMIENNIISESGITYNSNGGGITANICSYISQNSFNGNIIYNEVYSGIEGNYGGSQIAYNCIKGGIFTNSADIENNTNVGDIITNIASSITYNSNVGSISDNNMTSYISNNSNNGDIHNNSHDGFIYRNSNNGYISNCVGAGGFNVTYNINNGDINNPAGLGAADITDTIVNK